MDSTVPPFCDVATTSSNLTPAQSPRSVLQMPNYEASVSATASRKKMTLSEWVVYKRMKDARVAALAAEQSVLESNPPASMLLSRHLAVKSGANDTVTASDMSTLTLEVVPAPAEVAPTSDAPCHEPTSVEIMHTFEIPVLTTVSTQPPPASEEYKLGPQLATEGSVPTSEAFGWGLASGDLVGGSEAPLQQARETLENNEEPVASNKKATLDDDVATLIEEASRYVRASLDNKLNCQSRKDNNRLLDSLFRKANTDICQRAFAAVWNMGLTNVGRDGVARALHAQILTIDLSTIRECIDPQATQPQADKRRGHRERSDPLLQQARLQGIAASDLAPGDRRLHQVRQGQGKAAPLPVWTAAQLRSTSRWLLLPQQRLSQE